ncbi:MAG: hemerythrin domain-containing protein [Pirellulales bacterium]
MTTRHKLELTRAIGEEHGELNSAIEALQEALVKRSAAPGQLLATFQELARCVRRHFEHEEEGGYFANVLETAPWLRDRVGELLRDHPEMTRQLDVLLEYTGRGTPNGRWWDSLDEMFTRFRETFGAHETAENNLLQESICRDVGTKD